MYGAVRDKSEPGTHHIFQLSVIDTFCVQFTERMRSSLLIHSCGGHSWGQTNVIVLEKMVWGEILSPPQLHQVEINYLSI